MILTAFLLSCGQNNIKQKEFEIKEKELNLKERELALKEKDSSIKSNFTLSTTATDTSKQLNIASIETKPNLPFVGTKYFMFMTVYMGYQITINQDETVLIKYIFSRGEDTQPSKVVYKGIYKKIMNGFTVKSDKILLDEKNCDDISGGLECEVPLRSQL